MAISRSDIDSKPASWLDSKCSKEKADIKTILENNDLAMSTMVKDRIAVLYTFEKRSQERTAALELAQHE